MEKTKASFKAVREECGLSQADMAEEFGLNIRSVKRWENPNEPNMPPDDVWSYLLECRAKLYEASKAMASGATATGDGPVMLTYYRGQGRMDAGQLNVPVGFANAVTRRAARILENTGREVGFEYPEYSGGPV